MIIFFIFKLASKKIVIDIIYLCCHYLHNDGDLSYSVFHVIYELSIYIFINA